MTPKPETQRDFRLRFFQLAVNHIADAPIWYEFYVTARFDGEDGSMAAFITSPLNMTPPQSGGLHAPKRAPAAPMPLQRLFWQTGPRWRPL